METEQLSTVKKTIVGVQFLFVAFGATVLVPLLIGIDPATALFRECRLILSVVDA